VLGFEEQSIFADVRLLGNLTHRLDALGILSLPLVACALWVGAPQSRRCWAFLLASSPYILGMVFIATTWEIRLWVPLWLGILALAGRDPAAVATSDDGGLLGGRSSR
jgi:hypothetical protein